MKNISKTFLIRAIVGVATSLTAVIATASIMLPSYFDWKTYYDEVMAEKARKEYLQTLPLEFLGISAELADGVVYYDNETAEPDVEDFSVRANFTEKGEAFSEKVSSKDFTIDVPENFAKDGGAITVTYYYTPEKAEDATEEPEPVKAETTVDIKLVTPDASVYKVVTMPTYTDAGVAENINGDKKTLPALNMTDYSTEKNSVGTKYKFTHKETGVVIKIPLEQEVTVTTTAGRSISYNNVTCNFADEVDGLHIAYENGSFSFAAEAGKEFALQKITGADVITFTKGNIRMTDSMDVTRMIVKSGATLSTEKTMTVNSLLVEEGATLNATASDDAIVVKRMGTDNHGKLELYGTVNVTRNTTETELDKTGIYLKRGSKMFLGENCSVTIDNYGYALVPWNDGGDAYMYIPDGASRADKKITLNGRTLLDASSCQTFGWSVEIKIISEYEVTVEPTATMSGKAEHTATGTIVTLPAFNYTDYDANINGSNITFAHKGTGLEFSLAINGSEPLQIGNLTIGYDSATSTYTYTVADGKEVILNGRINVTNLVLAGAGTLRINGNGDGAVRANTLTLKDGVTLNASGVPNSGMAIVFVEDVLTVNEGTSLLITQTSGAGDGMKLNKATTVAYLYGTVSVQGAAGATAITCAGGTNTDNGDGTYTAVSWIKIYLSETSRVSVTGDGAGVVQYSYNKVDLGMGIATVYYPEGATQSGNTVTANGNTLYSVAAKGWTSNAKYEVKNG